MDRIFEHPGYHNFRDLGGYQTFDGHTTRWRTVFRSGTLSEISGAGVDLLLQLQIRTVCDFRSGPEHDAFPNKWIENTTIDYWRWDRDVSVGDSLRLLQECSQSEIATRARMQEVYRQIPYEQAGSLQELFSRLASGQVPLVYHCAAGKDRTGVATALLLTSLGVPRDVIYRDYQLSDLFFERTQALFLSDPRHQELTQLHKSAWIPMLKSDTSYLDATFEIIEQNHGGITGYLNEVLNIGREQQRAIREVLLE